jgi:hypothetical protein
MQADPQEQSPSITPTDQSDLRRTALKRAIEQYDYIPMLSAVITGELYGLTISDTRLVQARLKHERDERNLCRREAEEYARKGMTMRARELFFFAVLHEETMQRAILYLKAVGADTTDFLAEQPMMFEVAA